MMPSKFRCNISPPNGYGSGHIANNLEKAPKTPFFVLNNPDKYRTQLEPVTFNNQDYTVII